MFLSVAKNKVLDKKNSLTAQGLYVPFAKDGTVLFVEAINTLLL
jgi:hypothetical protein